MFDHLDQEDWNWSAADRQLAAQMSAYWTQFVKHGDPNGKTLPHCPRFDGDDKVLHLNDAVVVRSLPDEQSLKIFDAVYAALRSRPLETQ